MSSIYKYSATRLHEQLEELKRYYVDFVTKNPEAVIQIEKTVKTTSYVVEALSSNYETSIFISEFVSSACNLFSYINSRLLSKSKKIFNNASTNQIVEKIKQFLLVIEVSQAFIEITAGRVGGSGAKWAVIVIICLVKAILRCLLIFLFRTGIQTNSLVSLLQLNSTAQDGKSEGSEEEIVYIGSRTGHKMRTLSSSPQKPSSSNNLNSNQALLNLPPTILTDTEKIGECLHAIRPLLHVLATGVCKSNSLIPWMVALITDASSHVLLQRSPPSPVSTLPPYNFNERNELRRRYANLAYYLMRSPIYEKYTEEKLLKIFKFLSNRVPLAKYLFEPLAKYIPEWQKIYFYTWSD